MTFRLGTLFEGPTSLTATGRMSQQGSKVRGFATGVAAKPDAGIRREQYPARSALHVRVIPDEERRFATMVVGTICEQIRWR